VGAGLELAVAEVGHGPMLHADRWLLVGSTMVVLGALALIQFASNPDASDVGRYITTTRLAGIPFLAVIGFLSELEPHWVVLGVLGVCVAQLVADMSSAEPARKAQAKENG
ncbi:MAG: hypothetical protein OEM39_03380, partial [Acidimicrobiia bacterium]|nr:hypothetical protein [Acidimicrobiia bacterium]